MKQENKKSCYEVKYVYILPGVYIDVTEDDTGHTPYRICLNALSLLFNNGFKKMYTLKKQLASSSVRDNGLVGKKGNRYKNQAANYESINESLDEFLKH